MPPVDTHRFPRILTHRASAQPNWTSAQKDNAKQSATLDSRACPHCGKVQRDSGGGLFLTVIWLNIKTTTLRESEYISATPTQQATWLKLLAYCAEHENGGVIDGAGDWNDRAWLFGCGVTLEEVRSSCALWQFDQSGNLSVWNYPVEKELEVSAKREAGRRGAFAKHARRKDSSTASGSAIAQPEAVPQAQPVAETDSASSSAYAEGVRSKGEGGRSNAEGETGKEKEVLATVSASPRKRSDARPQSAMDVVAYGMTLEPALPPVEAQRFWDYYESNGWRVGRNPMKDWKAAVRNWQRNASIATPNQNGNHSRPHKPSSRNGEGFTLSEERRAWLNADKLDGPESHRD